MIGTLLTSEADRPEKYWARPASVHYGDSEIDLLYSLVGQILSQWEEVELALANLFSVMSEADTPASSMAVNRTYGAIGFNSGRRQAVSFVAELYFGRQFWRKAKADLNLLLKHIEYASSRRDDVAHGRVTSVTVNGVYHGCFLVAPEYNTRFSYPYMGDVKDDPISFLRSRYRYTGNDLMILLQKLSQLRLQVHHYLSFVYKDKGRFGPSFVEKYAPSLK
jgi:hypothetical protein